MRINNGTIQTKNIINKERREYIFLGDVTP